MNAISKKIISKVSLERVVIDEWELDNKLKEITGYSWVIDMIDHFSKFLISIPVKNNNSQNIEICLKKLFNTVVYPKIIKSDNVTEYKNGMV